MAADQVDFDAVSFEVVDVFLFSSVFGRVATVENARYRLQQAKFSVFVAIIVAVDNATLFTI